MIYDFYGLHESFTSHLLTEHRTLDDRIALIQQRLEDEISSLKFKFRLQVHELEAYLFSRPETIIQHFCEPDKAAAIDTILNNFGNNPELINDHPDTAPSKRLFQLFPNFRKTTDGLLIAEKTGIPFIRERCRRFNELCRLFDDLG